MIVINHQTCRFDCWILRRFSPGCPAGGEKLRFARPYFSFTVDYLQGNFGTRRQNAYGSTVTRTLNNNYI